MSVFLRKIGWFIIDYAMNGAVDILSRLNLFHLESVQDLHERMNRIFQIISPLRSVTSLLLLFRARSQLLSQAAQVIKKMDEIMDERFLQRFVQKIVTVFQKLVVKRIK